MIRPKNATCAGCRHLTTDTEAETFGCEIYTEKETPFTETPVPERMRVARKTQTFILTCKEPS